MNNRTKIINVFAGPGTGKCFLKDTKIVMYDGTLKNIQDIVKDDIIMGIDSKPKKILEIHNGIDMMYKVEQSKGEPYIVNSQHLISLKRTAGSKIKSRGKNYIRYPELNDIIHIPVLELKNKSKKFFRCFKGFKVITEYNEQNITIDPYFLGLWLGDGCKNLASVCTMDNIIKNYVYKIANDYNLNIKEYKKNDNKGIDYRLTSNNSFKGSNKLLTELQELNLIKNKHIPLNYLCNSLQIRLELLAGLIDTDGNLTNNVLSITQKNEILAYQIKRLADSLGFKTSIKKVKKKIKSINFEGYYYNISIGGNIEKIPTKLYRKQIQNKVIKDEFCLGIKSITEYGIDNYYGFSCEDELFLLADNTVVHNSTCCAGIFYEMKKQHYNVELVTEYVKDVVYDNRTELYADQIYILAKQNRKILRLVDKVDYVLTDSPIIQNIAYTADNYYPSYNNVVKEMFNSYNNINFYLKRRTEYNSVGRYQNEQQDIELDNKILNILDDSNIKYHVIDNIENALNDMLKIILSN